MKLKAKKEFEKIIDSTIGRVRKNGEIFEVSEDRAMVLLKANLVEIVEEPKKEVVEEKIAEKQEVAEEIVEKPQKTTKKSTKKAKK